MGDGQTEGITVETGEIPPTPPEPKPRKPRTTRRKARGPVTQEHVTGWTVQLFSIAAMIKRSPWWQVEQPAIEVEPWAGQAADLINEHVDKEMAEKALALNAGVAVCVGIASMVMVRLQRDYEMRQQAVAVPSPRPGTHPQEPQPIRPTRGASGTGGGASPTRPSEPLTGLGMDVGGLR